MTSWAMSKLLRGSSLLLRSRDSRPEPFSCRSRQASTASKEEKKVVVMQEDTVRKPQPYKINWARMKRSWLFTEKYIEIFRTMFSWNDSHEGRARIAKENLIVYYFRNADDLTYWYVFTDEDGGGHSWAELRQGANEMTLLFRGYLSQKPPAEFMLEKQPPEKQVDYTGTVYLETLPFYTIYDRKEKYSLAGFNSIKMRIRGDGRKYWLEMTVSLTHDTRHAFRYPIHTRGGPLWEEVEIPFSKFSARHEGSGSFLTTQETMSTDHVENFRFLLNDGIEGPFQLEVDYIALTNNKKFTTVNDCSDTDVKDIHNPWQPINEISG